METKPVKIKESLQVGWQTWKSNLWFLVGVTALLFILPNLPSYIVNRRQTPELLDIVLIIIAWALSLVMSIGMIKITLAFIDSKKPEWKDLFVHSHYLLRYLGASILYALLVALGLVLLIVPGIYWGLKYQFVIYLVVDKDLGIREAFKRSGEMTTGVKWPLLGYAVLQILINYAGLLLFGVGLLVTAPVTMLAYAKIYRDLQKNLI